MQLRPYQEAAVAAVYQYCSDQPGKNPCVVAPTGAGKSHIIERLCRDMAGWGCRVLVVAHVRELLEQAYAKLSHGDLDVGLFSASLKRREHDRQVVVAGIQSIYKRGLGACGSNPFSLVIVDEAHRIPVTGDGQYRRLLSDLQTCNPKLRVVGLTATPYRTSTGLVCGPDHFLHDVCYEISIRDLVAQGFLCNLVSKNSVRPIDVSGVDIRKGEFVNGQMDQLFNVDDVVIDAVDEVVNYTIDRKRVIIFCCSVDHAYRVSKALSERVNGNVRTVTSKHSGRVQSVEDFKSGRCKYLVNVNCLTEGFDSPDIDCVVLLRATASPGLYYQMVGRGLRTSPNKSECLVLDFGGNVERHGTIDNIQPPQKKQSTAESAPPMKFCPECKSEMLAALRTCDQCGYEFPPNGPNHDGEASEFGPLDMPTVERYEITSVEYVVHQKRGQPDAPRSMRVTYYTGMNIAADEWVCVEHSGFAFEKAAKWWRSRSNNDMPKNAEEAVTLAQAGALREPIAIFIERKPGDKFVSVVRYEMPDERPMAIDKSELEAWIAADFGEVPF